MSKEESSGEVGSQNAPASDAPAKDPNADIYENRGRSKKIIRVVTVMAYLFSVSFVGILLSAYYIFLWEPPNPRLIEKARLRADPQVEFLIGEPYLEEADHLRKTENLLQENVPDRTYKSRPLLGRIAHDTADVPVDLNEASPGLSRTPQERMNAMLLKLKYSLMETLRENRRNRTSRLSHGTTSSRPDDYSFLGIKEGEKVINSTRNSSLEYGETLREDVSMEKSQVGDGIGILNRKLTNLSSALPVEDPLSSTSKPATISDIKAKRIGRSGGRPVDRDVTPIVGGKTRHFEEEIHVVGPYTVSVNESSDSRSNHDIKMRRDNDGHGKNETTKRERNFVDRQVIDHDREEDPSDALEIASGKRPDSQTNSSPSVNNNVNNCSGRNCSGNNECCTSYQTERIARDRVSIDSSVGSRFADDPSLHQPPDDPAVKPTYAAKFQRNSEASLWDRAPVMKLETKHRIPRQSAGTSVGVYPFVIPIKVQLGAFSTEPHEKHRLNKSAEI